MKRSSGVPTAAEARAEAEAAAAGRAAERRAQLDAHFADAIPGRPILNVSVGSTVAFAVMTVIAVAVDTRTVGVVSAVVDLALFVAGCVVFMVSLYVAAQRSRDDELTMSGWWFLSGTAPASVRRVLLGSLTAQVVIGVVGASLRPFGPLAFGVLVPMFGLALTGLWGAKHGMFPARRPTDIGRSDANDPGRRP